MPTLYHFPGAICAQKVRVALAEKNVAWESRDCSGPGLRNPEYLKLNPNGVVPTLVDDGEAIIESRIISEYINDKFDGASLMPMSARERYRARSWTKQVDDSLHINVYILTFLSGVREIFLNMPAEVRAATLPGLRDPIKRGISEDLLERGWDAHWAGMAVGRFRRLVTEMEASLSKSDYLAGSTYSLADADLTPYFNRLNLMGLDQLFVDRPAITDWWDRMQARPSFKAAILDWNDPQDLQRYSTARERYGEQIGKLVQITPEPLAATA